MFFEDEKDYMMRMIKEMIRALLGVFTGTHFQNVELPPENKCTVAGNNIHDFTDMIDQGKINEAENLLLEGIDYNDRQQVEEAVYFYKYLSEKEERFLKENDYSMEEVVDGLRTLIKCSGYGVLLDD